MNLTDDTSKSGDEWGILVTDQATSRSGRRLSVWDGDISQDPGLELNGSGSVSLATSRTDPRAVVKSVPLTMKIRRIGSVRAIDVDRLCAPATNTLPLEEVQHTGRSQLPD